MGHDDDRDDAATVVDEESRPPQGAVEGQPGEHQVGRGIEQRSRHGAAGVHTVRVGVPTIRVADVHPHLVDEVGPRERAGTEPHRPPGPRRSPRQPLAEAGHGGRPPQEDGAELVGGRACFVGEDEQGADRHRHPAAVDRQLEDVVGSGAVDQRCTGAAHVPTLGVPGRRGP